MANDVLNLELFTIRVTIYKYKLHKHTE